jgi:hypothetical protein
MADVAIDVRLARLHSPGAAPSRIRRAATCGAAGTVAAMIPFITAAGLLVAVAVVACTM